MEESGIEQPVRGNASTQPLILQNITGRFSTSSPKTIHSLLRLLNNNNIQIHMGVSRICL